MTISLKKIVIVGCGGFGREALALINQNFYEPIGFIDQNPNAFSQSGYPIIGDDRIIPTLAIKKIATSICIALGNPAKRAKIFQLSEKYGLDIPSIAHPSSIILSSSHISDGTIVYPNVVVMNDCTIGKGVLLNTNVTIGHDVTVGNFCNINPGARLAGRITIGEGAFIGIGATIIENITVGAGATIGAGSVVIRDVPENSIVYGVPAREKN